MSSREVGKWTEISWPWILAVGAAAWALARDTPIMFAQEIQVRLLDKAVDVCAISIGFWATALALLLALDDRTTVAGLRKVGVYGRVVGYFLSTLYAYFFLLLLSISAIAIGRPKWLPQSLYTASWCFIVALSVAAMLRSFMVLGKLLRAR